MKKNAIYPGTFDPITFGHIDVIKKALKIVDTVVVAISETDNKNYFFKLFVKSLCCLDSIFPGDANAIRGGIVDHTLSSEVI